MRTTLNLDDDLMERMLRLFPPGTSKTVILEECLRRALAAPPPPSRPDLPDDIGELVRRGLLTPASRTGLPPQSELPPLPPGTLARDLASDREDR